MGSNTKDLEIAVLINRIQTPRLYFHTESPPRAMIHRGRGGHTQSYNTETSRPTAVLPSPDGRSHTNSNLSQ